MRGQPELIRRKESPIWYIKIPGHGGRRPKRISTGETDREQAERVFAQFLLERKRPQLSRDDEIRVIDLIERYIHEQGRIRPHDKTAEYHQRILKPFFKDMFMSQLTRQVIRDYIDMRQASPAKRGKHESATRKISPGTVRRELDTLSAALNFCHREGLIANVPYIEKPKPSPPREKWIKESQFGLLLAECEKRKYLMDYIMIAINTSARPGAITQLKWEQMDFENRVVDFNPEGRRQNNKIRSAVYMNDVFYEYFLERHKEAKSEWVVTRPRNGEYGPIASIKNSFKAACTRAGLTGITPYTLRHTACTWMRKSGIDLKDIGDIAGHRDPRTTMRYVKYDPEFTKGGTSKLSTGVEHAMRIAAAVKKEKDTVKNEENKG